MKALWKNIRLVVLTMMSLREAASQFVQSILGVGAGWVKLTVRRHVPQRCRTTVHACTHHHVRRRIPGPSVVQPDNVVIAYHFDPTSCYST